MITAIDTFSGSFFVHRGDRGERREKQIVGWLQASLFELRPDKPPEKLKEYLGAWGRVLSDITSACSATLR